MKLRLWSFWSWFTCHYKQVVQTDSSQPLETERKKKNVDMEAEGSDTLNSSVLILPPVAGWQWALSWLKRGNLMSFPTGKVAKRVHPLWPSVTENKNSATVVRLCLYIPRLHSYPKQTEEVHNVWIIKLHQNSRFQLYLNHNVFIFSE